MKYAICKGVLWQETDGEIVIVAPKQDPAYLNVSGSSVWKLIDKGLDETKIVERLSKEYDEDENIIKKDVLSIIKDLIKNKYIKEVK
ncbi:MAG: PqqD family protein [Elusimicrobia bacterium]|nr:PqqD family protein [Elusimicrobiota bacterium]